MKALKGMDIIELFDKQCELFKFDTGYFAPGKDISPAVGINYSFEEEMKRSEAWKNWHKGFLRGMEVLEENKNEDK